MYFSSSVAQSTLPHRNSHNYKIDQARKEHTRCVWHQKLFLLFLALLFYWRKKWKISGSGDVDKKTLPNKFKPSPLTSLR